MQLNPQDTVNTNPEIQPQGKSEYGKTPFQLALARFMKNKLAVAGVIILTLIIIMVILAPFFTDQSPTKSNLMMIERPPSADHPLGNDSSGRDNLSRFLYGGRISLIVGFSAMLFTLVIGVTLGSIAGYYGGKIDAIIMRAADMMLVLPFLVIVLTVVAVLEKVTIGLFVTIIALTTWPNLTRIIRGTYLSLREQEFILGVKAIGASDARIIFKHFIPNAIGPIVVNASLMMATMIIVESALSFIGFGIPQPTPTWGNMISEAQSLRILRNSPEAWIPPGLAILTTVLCINFIGDGLRDAFDPKSNRR
ncbi:peptide ABC transporter permease [Bacillus canaveralius]|uniref:Peptide ABC transporter permease n=1 Tax=Bacillus canaveralius TaxID=1403243 RepID=A0A2N5GSU5_9BACI|nr:MULTISPECIES: oligopeptide ABC transporter permease [Bacillus]PLR83577.1 peptide ABC transporter permease [Bacillus sp. V33-4]PLR86836.1 peptide ABC transporter permease [Bacillus canaveralius]PLR92703.1 peptide ABC transporter permease [Bacillus canaveralius]RSK53683.1 ABC transporter permease [Bacillus canaveralius]